VSGITGDGKVYKTVKIGDNVMASAIIDRIVHHASIIRITGSSYRIKNYKDELTGNEKTNEQPSNK